MIIQTDVKCLYCGHVSWRIEMEHGAPWSTAEMVAPEPGGTLPAHPRCARCNGPVFLDGDFRQVRVRQSEVRARLARLRSGAEAEPVEKPARKREPRRKAA